MTHKKHTRRTIRLKGYDYTQNGAYFVTICTYKRQSLLGYVSDNQTILSQYGQIVAEEWQRTGQLRADYVILDEWIVMPNHFHAIVIIDNIGKSSPTSTSLSEPSFRLPAKSLGSIIGSFKSAVTKRVNQERQTEGAKFWHRNYYEHIIRNERAFKAIQNYIRLNPTKMEK